MRSITSILSLLLITAVAGCSKKSSTEGKASEDKGATDRPDFAAWDPTAKQKAWQGSWLVLENGTVQAWSVTGDQVQTWDGKEDKTYTLTFDAPCRAHFGHNGMKMPREFSVVDGKLQFRASGAGYRKGKEALWCDPAGDFYTLGADGTCQSWKADDFGKKLTKSAGVCGFKQGTKGTEVFFHEGTNGGEFEVRGDAILANTSFETEKVEGDHAAAKAARDAKATK
jgi:hypothetical protein